MPSVSSASGSGAPALEFDDVSVVLGGRLIWSEGTFDVPAGGITAVIGSRNRTFRVVPLPPCHLPVPPLPGRMAKLSSSTGKRCSSTSGSVRRELVISVCTPEVPSNPGPAPDPPQIVS